MSNPVEEYAEEQSGSNCNLRELVARRHLSQTEERYRLLIESANVLVWEFNWNENRFEYVSPSAADFGYPMSDWLTPGFWQQHIHPDERDEIVNSCASSVERDEAHKLTYRFMAADGREIWVDDFVAVPDRSEGRVIVRGVWVDITRAKVTERQRENSLKLSLELNGALTKHEACEATVEALCAVYNTGRAAVLLFPDTGSDGKEASCKFVSWRGISDDYRAAVDGHCPWKQFEKNPVPICIEECSLDPTMAPYMSIFDSEGIESLGFFPIVTAQGVVGKLMIYFDRPQTFTPETISLGHTISTYLGLALSRLETTDQLKAQHAALISLNQELDTFANIDPLTNLYNRRKFFAEASNALQTANQTGNSTGILLVDLDNFKVINDSLGHPSGDKLLMTVASRLTKVVREGDMVARIGGDEFAIFLNAPLDESLCSEIATNIATTMSYPISVAGRKIISTASVGIKLSKPESTLETLIQGADLAMYNAKSKGKSQFCFFEDWMTIASKERLQMESDLRQAIANNEFELHYMPIVDFETRQIRELEALVRWNHPTDGLVPPDKFIALAEELGVIVPLGTWVLNEACRQLTEWKKRHSEWSDLRVAVNVSPHQLRRPDFISEVLAALESTGMDPDHLTLEITETAIMTDFDRMTSILANLKTFGIQIAMDDFGTGYSSMGTLSHIPINTVKIDRSFVKVIGTDMASTAIIRTIVTLCKVLNLNVVAEGLETPDQFNQLFSLGCDLAQGYMFSKPLSAQRIEEWMCAEQAKAA